jgi:hypothetical protein
MTLPVILLRQYAEIRARFGDTSSQARKAAELLSASNRPDAEADTRVYLESMRAKGQFWCKATQRLRVLASPPPAGTPRPH